MDLVRSAQSQQFPLLLLANDNIGRVEKIQETLSFAVSSDEPEGLESAKKMAKAFAENINQSKAIDNKLNDDLSDLQNLFDDYYGKAHSISSGMLNNEIDFSTLPARSEDMAKALEKLTEQPGYFLQQSPPRIRHGLRNRRRPIKQSVYHRHSNRCKHKLAAYICRRFC